MNKDELFEIKKLKLGDILKDGSIVTGIIKLSNRSYEDFYEFTNQGEENTNIYVTGEHYIKFQKNEKISINNKEKLRILAELSKLFSDSFNIWKFIIFV
jgi:hypothetical protein